MLIDIIDDAVTPLSEAQSASNTHWIMNYDYEGQTAASEKALIKDFLYVSWKDCSQSLCLQREVCLERSEKVFELYICTTHANANGCSR